MAVRDKLMRRDAFEAFCREYVRENRLRMEDGAKVSQGRHELSLAEREIKQLIQAIKDGVAARSIRDELQRPETRNAELERRVAAPNMPRLLHPAMADVYRDRVTGLVQALERANGRVAATESIRELIEAIVLEPDGEALKVTLKGNRAGMLQAARSDKRSPDSGDLLLQIQMVAGARNKLYRRLCWAAA